MDQLVGIALLAVLYGLAYARVRGRTSRWRAASFALTIAILLAAAVSPIDRLGEQRYFSVHMVQHLMIGDLAPLFVVLGVDGPLLRPLLALRLVRRLQPLVHPLVALPLWALNLCVWHTTLLYDAALRHDAMHALQHTLFFACGVLVWSALLEPLPGPAWFTSARKLVYVGAMWIVSLGLAQFFVWSGRPYYARYAHFHGALADQRAGGGAMLVEGTLVMIGVVVWLLLRVFAEGERRETLMASGVAPTVAARAARYGRTLA
jgi:cytochrome c oxidase assembly factor CtaG